VALLPDDLPRASGIRVDGVLLLFAAGVSVGAGLLTGLVPALRGARPRLPTALRAGGRGSIGTGGTLAARTLVTAQLALACVLLVGAGLLIRSVQALHAVDLGARTERTLTVEFLLAQQGGRDEVVAFMRNLEQRIEALPGVEAAALAYNTPLDADWTETFSVLDRPPPGPGERPGADFRTVSPGYFEQLGIAPVAGRTLEGRDGPEGAPVVVVNETFARRHFDGEEVLGRRIAMGTARAAWGDEAPAEWEIVGVVRDVRMRGLRRPAPAAFYFSQRQAPTTFFRLLIRTRGEPMSVLPDVRAVVAELDPRLPLSSIATLDELRARATAQDRFNALFLGAFALVALLVAAAGIYGVLAYAVARRTTEMGVRLALGARPAGVFRLLVREGVGMAAIGLVVGLGGALAGARLLGALLFGVTAWDPAVLAAVTGVLAAVVLVAGAVPARRAARTDPAVALRGE
jgi:predicted permease